MRNLKRIVVIMLITIAIVSVAPIGGVFTSAETAYAGDPKPP